MIYSSAAGDKFFAQLSLSKVAYFPIPNILIKQQREIRFLWDVIITKYFFFLKGIGFADIWDRAKSRTLCSPCVGGHTVLYDNIRQRCIKSQVSASFSFGYSTHVVAQCCW